MRNINCLFLFCLLFLITIPAGCIMDDQSDCPADNFTLRFSYRNSEGEEAFSDHIETVSVYLFNENLSFHREYRLNAVQLTKFPGIKLSLDPGIYYVVCLGNTDHEKVEVTGINGWDDFLFRQGKEFWDLPVYYAPDVELPGDREEYDFFSVEIPENGVIDKTIQFRNASRTVKVVVEGFTGGNEEQPLPPEIHITNLPAGTDFYLNHLNEKITYRKRGDPVLHNLLKSEVLFHTPWFFANREMDITLYRQTNGTPVHTVNMEEVLKNEGYHPGAMEPIEIHIGFLNGQVVVTIPGWSDPGGYVPEL